MSHFGFEWWWQLWCGLMTLLIVSNTWMQTVNSVIKWASNKSIWLVETRNL